jgi:hypothetical protein
MGHRYINNPHSPNGFQFDGQVPKKSYGEPCTLIVHNRAGLELPYLAKVKVQKSAPRRGERSQRGKGPVAPPTMKAIDDMIHGQRFLEMTFYPQNLCSLPTRDYCADSRLFTPTSEPNSAVPHRHVPEDDAELIPMMMGGLPSCKEKKLTALETLSAVSNEAIGLVDMYLFPDGTLQEHSGGHVAFFYVQGAAAAANVMKWSKCILMCDDEVVVAFNSLNQPLQGEQLLRTIIPLQASGAPMKLGHPCPIEVKTSVPRRRDQW